MARRPEGAGGPGSQEAMRPGAHRARRLGSQAAKSPGGQQAKSKEAKTRKIFVGGVSQETSSEEVKKYFSQFGECAI